MLGGIRAGAGRRRLPLAGRRSQPPQRRRQRRPALQQRRPERHPGRGRGAL